MAVRTTKAVPLRAQVAVTGDLLRPDYDWAEAWEGMWLNKPSWYYPMQTGPFVHPRLSDSNSRRSARLGMGRTLDAVRPVRGASKRALTFTDLFYGRLQLNPSFLDLGNILNAQTRKVELWNATFEPQVVREVAGQNVDGVELSLPYPLPYTLAPLEAFTFEVGISTTGPVKMDVTFEAKSDSIGSVSLNIIGNRAVIFGLLPDTSKSYIEKMEWITDVFTAYDSTEQRITLNDFPDTTITMNFRNHQSKVHNLESLLWGWQQRIYALPLWHRGTNLTEPVYVGRKTVPCDTTYGGFRAGGLAVIWSDYDSFEAVDIEAVNADHLVVKREILRDWPRGALVIACRSARLPQNIENNWEHANLANIQLEFLLTDVEQETPFEWPTTYRNEPLVLIAPNWVDPMKEQHVTNLEAFESEVRGKYTVVQNDRPYLVRSFSWFHKSKERIHLFRRWLYARRGRAVPFWAPSWRNDLTLMARIEEGAVQITVANINYTTLYTSPTGRQDIIIFLKNGTNLTRRIIGAAGGATPDLEILTLEAEIRQRINPSEVSMICFLGSYRLDSDAAELDWRSDKLALCNQNMRLLTDGV